MPTDTILIIRCPHCMAGIEFKPPAAGAEKPERRNEARPGLA